MQDMQNYLIAADAFFRAQENVDRILDAVEQKNRVAFEKGNEPSNFPLKEQIVWAAAELKRAKYNLDKVVQSMTPQQRREFSMDANSTFLSKFRTKSR